MSDDKFGAFLAGYFLGGCGSPRAKEFRPTHPIRSGVIVVLAVLLLVHCIDVAFPNARSAGARSTKPTRTENVRHAPHPAH
jgi:hypothetical protein